MSLLLARIARTLTQHWKRSLAAALLVIVALGAAAGAGGEAADDFSIPGTESQQALDLFKAHSPAFAGADSTLVFSVDQGRIDEAGPRAATSTSPRSAVCAAASSRSPSVFSRSCGSLP